jgi:hypothetical protein
MQKTVSNGLTPEGRAVTMSRMPPPVASAKGRGAVPKRMAPAFLSVFGPVYSGVSQREHQTLISLPPSARHFKMGPTSRNYTAYLKQSIGSQGR